MLPCRRRRRLANYNTNILHFIQMDDSIGPTIILFKIGICYLHRRKNAQRSRRPFARVTTYLVLIVNLQCTAAKLTAFSTTSTTTYIYQFVIFVTLQLFKINMNRPQQIWENIMCNVRCVFNWLTSAARRGGGFHTLIPEF